MSTKDSVLSNWEIVDPPSTCKSVFSGMLSECALISINVYIKVLGGGCCKVYEKRYVKPFCRSTEKCAKRGEFPQVMSASLHKLSLKTVRLKMSEDVDIRCLCSSGH